MPDLAFPKHGNPIIFCSATCRVSRIDPSQSHQLAVLSSWGSAIEPDPFYR